ncbi:MAG: ABC transporter permease [Termitinemataceae bacterium]|nr:MAG: ABC transporter permease [Termitinemataceae bacterium]
MLEDLIYAFRTFKRSKTRTLLSLLGVIIGVASVIIITTLGESASNNVKKTFSTANLNMVQINAGFVRRNRGATVPTIELNENWRQEIFDSTKNIKKIWFNNNFSATLSLGDLSVSKSVSAVEYGFLETNGLRLGGGNYFNVSDCEEGTQVIILGSAAAEALFPNTLGTGAVDTEKIIGAQIKLVNGDVSFGFTVKGVLTGATSGFESSEEGIYVTRGFYEKKIAPNTSASTAVIEALDPKSASKITEEMRDYAFAKTGDSFALRVNSMQTMLDQYDEVSGTMSLMLSGIAAISLLVGGIGIMNIMIVTVTERKKEIGIRKAIGASPAAIRMQFLIEAAAITLTGGIIGIICGLIISFTATIFLKWSFSLQPQACLYAFLFSVLVGVFFGFYPASRASKLDPVEALAAE